MVTGNLETRANAELAVRFIQLVEGIVGVVDRLRFRVDERVADSRMVPM